MKERKNIIQIEEKQAINYEITSLGEEIIKQDISSAKNLLEELTPEMLKTSSWKNKKTRRSSNKMMPAKVQRRKGHQERKCLPQRSHRPTVALRRDWGGHRGEGGNRIEEPRIARMSGIDVGHL